MKTVWKYEVLPGSLDGFTLELPEGSHALTVQYQPDVGAVMWVLVDTEAPMTPRRFKVVGTGHPLGVDADRMTYVGTFQVHAGALVFHLFEVQEGES